MNAAIADSEQGNTLLALYEEALPQVYGHLHTRCRHQTIAEDLTTEVFLAAVESVRRSVVADVTVAWLIGIARHKIVDHWRRVERDTRRLQAVEDNSAPEADNPWDVHLDVLTARDVLADLGAHHRSALTLRYVDDLPVADVARILDRTLHATEALLVRARNAFRVRYEVLGSPSPTSSPTNTTSKGTEAT